MWEKSRNTAVPEREPSSCDFSEELLWCLLTRSRHEGCTVCAFNLHQFLQTPIKEAKVKGDPPLVFLECFPCLSPL